MKKIVLCISLVIILLCGCNAAAYSTQNNKNEVSTNQEKEANIADQSSSQDIVEYDGKTAVLITDAALLNAYSGLSDDTGKITWIGVSDTVELKKGDIVISIKEKEDVTVVYVPTSDTPMALYGEIPSKSLSQKSADIEMANTAVIMDQMIYAERNGNSVGTLSGPVRVIERFGEWCKIEPISYGGEDTGIIWTKTDNLSYDFDMKIMAKAE